MNNPGDFKDKAALFAWIAGLLLITSLLWIVTSNLQSNYLMRTVNNVFMGNNDQRRLSGSLQQRPQGANRQAFNLFGYWYSMHNSTDLMFVFSVFRDGIMIPLGAIVSQDGKVSEIIPLSAHAVYVFDTLPQSILQMYINRIEGNRE
ncbi:MAG: hypothetical protein LBC80_00635 [Treponema sp.]|jgi:hypothetical protein|nr:hypothetical protein [Treponema sp.]